MADRRPAGRDGVDQEVMHNAQCTMNNWRMKKLLRELFLLDLSAAAGETVGGAQMQNDLSFGHSKGFLHSTSLRSE